MSQSTPSVTGSSLLIQELDVGSQSDLSSEQIATFHVYWTLRLTAALCFIGHGAFGFITKESWIPFFTFFGISREWGYWWMPLVGGIDVAVGLTVLFFSWRPAIIYMVMWATWTALLRPFVGLGWWEFFERAGNYGVPLALLYFCAPGASLLSRCAFRQLLDSDRTRLIITLQLVSGLLLMGHAGFGLMMDKGVLFHHWRSVSTIPDVLGQATFVHALGLLEFFLGGLMLVWARAEVACIVLIWKLVSEMLYPISGDYIWEFIERSGSYGAPLALFLLLRLPTVRNAAPSWPLLLLERLSFRHSCPPWQAHLALVLLAIIVGSSGILAFVGPRQFATSDYALAPHSIKLLSGQPLLNRLKAGGNVLYFRHFHTTSDGVNDDTRQWEIGRMPESAYEDCSWQRPLTEFGRTRARMVGAALQQLEIPIDRIIASPFCRCRESAALLTGRTPETFTALVFPRMEHTRERAESFVHNLLAAGTSSSGNTVVVAHRPPMDQFGRIMEGEAYIFSTDHDQRYDLIGRVEPHEWTEARINSELLGLRWQAGYVQPHR